MTFPSLETPWGSQRRERRYPPLGALSLFGFTLAIFLCQVSPIPGVATMMLGAPFWSVATINLGMLSLVVEALLGITWRWVLIVPLLYFGGYEACAVVSHVQLARLQGEIGRSNSATHLAFDSAAERLGGKDLTPLLVRYGLPAVYEPNGATDGPAWRALRLARTATCRQLTTASTAHADYHGSDTCIVSSAETPDLPMVVVSSSVTTPRLQGLHDVEIETVTMTRPDGASVATRAGHAAALGWFPAPVLGCALMSTTRWGCQAGFMFADRAPLVRELKQYEGRQEAMARALGLAAVAPRVEQTDAQARSLVTAANEDAIVRDLARLHAFMDDPDARTPAFF